MCYSSAIYHLRDPSQVSAAVTLSKGQVYYVEALMKETWGGDHVSVGVKLPSGVLQRPISNSDVYINPPSKFIRGVLSFVTVFCRNIKSY